MPELLKYLGQYEEPSAWYTVGRMLDISVPLGAIVREGTAGDIKDTTRKASAVVVSPSGKQNTMGEGGSQTIELAEQGFYSIRMQGTGERRPYEVAVNLDPFRTQSGAMDLAWQTLRTARAIARRTTLLGAIWP